MSFRYVFRIVDLLIKIAKIILLNVVSIIVLAMVKGILLSIFGKVKIFSAALPVMTDVLNFMIHLTTLSIFILLVTFAVLIGPEVVARMLNDSISNLKESLSLTIHLRNFLKKHGEDEIIETYNNSIKKARIDIQGRELLMVIDLPNNLEVQQMIFNSSEDIADQVASLTMDKYFFSGIRRVRSYLVLEGTKVPY